MPIEKVISGGQTGVDRAALDAAIELNIPHGGWCPAGRRAEDGRIPDKYQLRETESWKYTERTERNVIDSDGTLVLFRDKPTGGTAFTVRMINQHAKPFYLVDLSQQLLDAQTIRDDIVDWALEHRVKILNVAGPRHRTDPELCDRAREFLKSLFLRMRDVHEAGS